MEAICWGDYHRRVKAFKAAAAEKIRRQEQKELAEKARQRRAKSGKAPLKQTVTEDDTNEAGEIDSEVVIPKIGFEDCYGIWFYGELMPIIIEIGKNRFNADLSKLPHVYIDVEPKKIPDGIHDMAVYGHDCRLYKWTAQGYPRGLVVLKDDLHANLIAAVYRESETWSWVLSESQLARMPVK